MNPPTSPVTLTALALLIAALGAGNAATLTLNGSSFEAGTSPTITASFSDHTGGSSTDWIGVYPGGEVPDGDPVSTWWTYVDGTQSSGSVNVGSPFTSADNSMLGTWTVHFLANDGYGHVAGDTQVDFEIIPATTAAVNPGQAAYGLGDTVTIGWSGNAGVTSTDWIGIYAQGATPGVVGSLTYQYAPSADGSTTFTGLAEGSYDVYLLANDGYRTIAQSSFQVVPEPTTALLGFTGLLLLIHRRR